MDFLIEIGKLAPSLLFGIVIVWFVTVTRREDRAEREARNHQIIEERAKRDAEWQTFLAQQNSATLLALDAVATNLNKLNECTSALLLSLTELKSDFGDHNRYAEKVAADVTQLEAFVHAVTLKTAAESKARKGAVQG